MIICGGPVEFSRAYTSKRHLTNEVGGNKEYMDPNNPVVKLCMEGMAAEARGKFDDARHLFEQAWSICQDDYDACMAAHFLARHQDSPQATFK